MQTVHVSREVTQLSHRLRQHGESIAFVPTMGNLHAGHLKLVEEARNRAEHVITSVFVNPIQFGPQEDFAEYPHTPEEDSRLLAEAGAHTLFLPPQQEIYAGELSNTTRVEVPALDDILCGASRPGHFTGVATVVLKLFNIVQPDMAFFGRKDFQQLRIIERMCRDLHMAVEIEGVETVRETDGLAMSSRNMYLTHAERARATTLYATLQATAARLRDRGHDIPLLEAEGEQALQATGFRPDYYSIRRSADLQTPSAGGNDLVVLAAAWLGCARLIDNVEVTL